MHQYCQVHSLIASAPPFLLLTFQAVLICLYLFHHQRIPPPHSSTAAAPEYTLDTSQAKPAYLPVQVRISLSNKLLFCWTCGFPKGSLWIKEGDKGISVIITVYVCVCVCACVRTMNNISQIWQSGLLSTKAYANELKKSEWSIMSGFIFQFWKLTVSLPGGTFLCVKDGGQDFHDTPSYL